MSLKNREHLAKEIENVLEEMSDREKHRTSSGFKMIVWKSSIWFAYALKRFVDIVFSIAALIVLSPLFLVLAVIIKLTSPGPVFFVQARVGRYGKTFTFYKFRSIVYYIIN